LLLCKPPKPPGGGLWKENFAYKIILDIYLMNKKIRSPKYVIELARKMRINLTAAEEILWNELKENKLNGFKFRNQHPVYRYILDFYCHKKLLAIEIDGDIHKQKQNYDKYRDEFLKNIGIKTLRFTNENVLNNTKQILELIRIELYR
jgi:very-short-patch-repair endonuclease